MSQAIDGQLPTAPESIPITSSEIISSATTIPISETLPAAIPDRSAPAPAPELDSVAGRDGGNPGGAIAADWELDYYSRPILEPDGKKRWELLIASSPTADGAATGFRWARPCSAANVNSAWLREALAEALEECRAQGFAPPRRVRCWRASMRTMVQRAAETLGFELVASRRCYALVEWLLERQATVYPAEPGYMLGPLAPPPAVIQSPPVPLPEAARGQSWSWASLPLGMLREANQWDTGFAGLLPLPEPLNDQLMVTGLRLFGGRRALAIAGWLAGLEPVRLQLDGSQLVLEASLENRWLLGNLADEEAAAAAQAFQAARQEAGGLQFLAVQADADQSRFEGFWMLRDLPDA